MANKPNFRGVPGIPLHALDAIQDENTRQVVRALVDGWHTRNGSAGDGDNRFITKAEIGDVVKRMGFGVGATGSAVPQPGQGAVKPGEVEQILAGLQQSVFESRLFKELGERIDLIDKPGGIFDRLTDIGARIDTEQTVRANADTAQITSINNLLVRTSAAEASIVTERTARINGDNALLTSFNALGIRVGNNEAGLVNETNARVNADNAIISTTNTQFSQVNGSLSLVQGRVDTLSNNVASVASQVNQVQVSLNSQSVAIQQETSARINADNDIFAKFTVKIDNNGYVSGFGLASTSNNSTPFSDFIVRADRFSIGSPSGPGIEPAIPFIVLTTPFEAFGRVIQPGVYLQKAFIADGVISNANIGIAQVDTLILSGEAVTVPRFATGLVGQDLSTTYGSPIASTTFTVNGMGIVESARMVATAVLTAYATTSNRTNLQLGIFVNDALNVEVAATFGDEGISVSCVGSTILPNGDHTVDMRVRCTPTPNGDSSKLDCTFVGSLIATTAKR